LLFTLHKLQVTLSYPLFQLSFAASSELCNSHHI
jgi:hypothetical protein